MIFIPNASYIAFIYDENGKTVDTKYIVKGDICIVLEYFDYDDASARSVGFPQDYRSLILHPKHGPVRTFVSTTRGEIL
jgi:hypothetical protein